MSGREQIYTYVAWHEKLICLTHVYRMIMVAYAKYPYIESHVKASF